MPTGSQFLFHRENRHTNSWSNKNNSRTQESVNNHTTRKQAKITRKQTNNVNHYAKSWTNKNTHKLLDQCVDEWPVRWSKQQRAKRVFHKVSLIPSISLLYPHAQQTVDFLNFRNNTFAADNTFSTRKNHCVYFFCYLLKCPTRFQKL